MKVTCGACLKRLRVEDWLADNVARCPMCNAVIRLPPAGSVDGANAVILTVEEATDLLRRRAEAGQMPTLTAGGPQSQPPETGKPPAHPKTEPLPAFLRQASASIREEVHEEPAKQKTRPLPHPAGPPAPRPGHAATRPASSGARRRSRRSRSSAPPELASLLAPPPPEPPPAGPADSAQPAGLLRNPQVPIAFLAGLTIGAIVGVLIARTVIRGPEQSSTPEVTNSNEATGRAQEQPGQPPPAPVGPQEQSGPPAAASPAEPQAGSPEPGTGQPPAASGEPSVNPPDTSNPPPAPTTAASAPE